MVQPKYDIYIFDGLYAVELQLSKDFLLSKNFRIGDICKVYIVFTQDIVFV